MTAGREVTVNTAGYMQYLTTNTDPMTILEDPIIMIEIDLL